jgi:GNAT superfamily N-acetyltransferase
MDNVYNLAGGSMGEIVISGNRPGVLGKIIEMHGTYYDEHWHLGVVFEAKVGQVLADFLLRFNPEQDGFWTAWDGAIFVGTISIDGAEAATNGGRLRAFIINPAYQGHGIGHLLMKEAIDFCDRVGFKRVYLTTFAGLKAAHHLYIQYGFKLIHEAEDNHWGVVLPEQEWERLR